MKHLKLSNKYKARLSRKFIIIGRDRARNDKFDTNDDI